MKLFKTSNAATSCVSKKLINHPWVHGVIPWGTHAGGTHSGGTHAGGTHAGGVSVPSIGAGWSRRLGPSGHAG